MYTAGLDMSLAEINDVVNEFDSDASGEFLFCRNACAEPWCACRPDRVG